MSPLGFSVMLFLLHGILYIAIGFLTPIFWNRTTEQSGLIISYRTDKRFFGDEPQKIFQENTSVYKMAQVTLAMLAGMLFIAGIYIVSVTWFGLKAGLPWAYYTLAVAGIAGLPFWWLVFRPYFNAGITITLADAPPFIWVPSLLYLPAVILGWIGLR